MTLDKTPQYLRLDERNHVEKPFLEQLHGLGLGDYRPRQQTTPQRHLVSNFYKEYLDLSIKSYILCDKDRLYSI